MSKKCGGKLPADIVYPGRGLGGSILVDDVRKYLSIEQLKEMGYNCPPLNGGKKQRKTKTTIGRRNRKSTRKNNSSRKNSNKTWGRR